MPNFLLLLISHGSENLFDLDIFGTSSGKMEVFSSLLIQREGGGSHIGLLLGRVGFRGSQAGNISSRMLCL